MKTVTTIGMAAEEPEEQPVPFIVHNYHYATIAFKDIV